jgi:hypothetical protein
MRFIIMDACNHSGGWGLVSICFECFKRGSDTASQDSGIGCDRKQCECNGCGEPISLPIPPAGQRFAGFFRWFKHGVCSMRCYQRYRRKRIRKHGSMIDWKSSPRQHVCKACSKRFVARTDAKFCSAKEKAA